MSKPLSVYLLSVFLVFSSNGARADADAATSAYFANLQKWHYDSKARPSSVIARETLVRGLYRLEDLATGQFIALITERGDLKGDSSGWSTLGEYGPKELTKEEMGQLRREVMRNVRWDRLIRVQYGDGGARRLILISAVNCPYCRKMEANLARVASTLQTTFYVLPSSLTPLDEDGPGKRTWQQATDLWCARDGEGWTKFWVTGQLPSAQNCPLDAATAERTFRSFGTVLASIGASVRGTPELIREDGSNIGVPPSFDSQYASSTYGAAGRPAEAGELRNAKSDLWLTRASH